MRPVEQIKIKILKGGDERPPSERDNVLAFILVSGTMATTFTKHEAETIIRQ